MEMVSNLKKVSGKSQHGFTNGKSCLTSLFVFYDEASCLMHQGRAMASLILTLTRFLTQRPTTSLPTSW